MTIGKKWLSCEYMLEVASIMDKRCETSGVINFEQTTHKLLRKWELHKAVKQKFQKLQCSLF